MIGEPTIGLPSMVNVYKNKEENKNLIFPVKTVLMLISLMTLVTISWIRKKHHERNGRNVQQDVAFNRCLERENTIDKSKLQVP